MVMNSEYDKHDKILNDEIIMNHGQLYKYRYINYDNAHQIELKSLEIYCKSTIKKYMNYPIWLTKSLWPHDAIGRRISGRTFAQVMACCIREPNVDLSSGMFCRTHMRANKKVVGNICGFMCITCIYQVGLCVLARHITSLNMLLN